MTQGVENNNSISSKVVSTLAFPSVIQAGKTAFYVGRNAKMGRGFNSLKILKDDAKYFKTLQGQLKGDAFTKSKVLKQAYDDYKNVIAQASKTKNSALVEDFLNNGLTKYVNDSAKTANELASKGAGASFIDNAFGDKIAQHTAKKAQKEAEEQVVKSAEKTGFFKGLGEKIGKHFPFILNAAFVVMDVCSKKDEIKESFNKEGFGGGIKKIAQIAIPSIANLAGFEVGGAIGGTIGATIGTAICPVIGTGIGNLFGNMIGGMFVGEKVQKATEKIVGYEEPKKDENIQAEQQNITYNNETLDNQNIQNENITENEQIPQDLTNENEIQVQKNNQKQTQKLDVTDKFEEELPHKKSGYKRPQNGVYQTAWVNQAVQNGTLSSEGKKRGYIA